MSSLSVTTILKAIRAALADNSEANILAMAEAAGLKVVKKGSGNENIIEHVTSKGKVIRGVVRTDLNYKEAKAIDEYTFKKEGG